MQFEIFVTSQYEQWQQRTDASDDSKIDCGYQK